MSKIRESIANAVMVTGAFDRLSGSTDTTTYQALNSFSVRTSGSNIIQGQVNRIKVTEVLMPYSLPTIIDATDGIAAANNTLTILGVQLDVAGAAITTTQTTAQITLPTGFYTGDEMQAAIAGFLTGPIMGRLVIAYDDTTNRLSFTNTSPTWAAGTDGTWYFFNVFAFGVTAAQLSLQKPNLAWTMGYRSLSAQYSPAKLVNAGQTSGNYFNGAASGPWIVPPQYANIAGTTTPQLPVFQSGYFATKLRMSPYSGRYTDYIDIVSHKLCGAQFVRDGNTNQNVVRRDIVARVYVADEISAQGNYEIGSRPFLIHRQFKCPKTMYWTVERSIDTIDLELYDMFGQPLPTGLGLGALAGSNVIVGSAGDYAVTFQVEEGPSGEQNENVGYRF